MKILERLALLKIWMGNGQSYASDLKYPIALAVTLKLYFPNIQTSTMLLIVLFIVILITLVGWLDMRFIKLHQRIAEISTEKYNPYFAKLKKKFK